MKKLIIAAGLLMTTSAYAQTEVLTGVTSGSVLGTGKRKSEIRRSAQWRRYLLCEIER